MDPESLINGMESKIRGSRGKFSSFLPFSLYASPAHKIIKNTSIRLGSTSRISKQPFLFHLSHFHSILTPHHALAQSRSRLRCFAFYLFHGLSLAFSLIPVVADRLLSSRILNILLACMHLSPHHITGPDSDEPFIASDILLHDNIQAQRFTERRKRANPI